MMPYVVMCRDRLHNNYVVVMRGTKKDNEVSAVFEHFYKGFQMVYAFYMFVVPQVDTLWVFIKNHCL